MEIRLIFRFDWSKEEAAKMMMQDDLNLVNISISQKKDPLSIPSLFLDEDVLTKDIETHRKLYYVGIN